MEGRTEEFDVKPGGSVRRLATILFILTVLGSAAGAAVAGEFGWTLSASASDPLASSGARAAGLVNVYLWYYCTNGNGLASAEFDVTGSAVPVSFTGANGFLNAGGPAQLLLAVGGCPSGPILAGSLLIFDAAGLGFHLCPTASQANGRNVSVECATLEMYPNDFLGYASDGSLPCASGEDLCIVVIDDRSWGSLKSLYR
jgi:hypothetical protein